MREAKKQLMEMIEKLYHQNYRLITEGEEKVMDDAKALLDCLSDRSMEYLDGEYRCDFCLSLSTKIAKLRLSDKIYNPCPDCLNKIEVVLLEWYQWASPSVKMLGERLRGMTMTDSWKVTILRTMIEHGKKVQEVIDFLRAIQKGQY